MSAASLIAIYFVVWWIVLFAVLPWGVRSQSEESDVVLGTEHGAPLRPMLIRKAIATSVVAAIVVGGIWYAIEVQGIDLRWVATTFDLRK